MTAGAKDALEFIEALTDLMARKKIPELSVSDIHLKIDPSGYSLPPEPLEPQKPVKIQKPGEEDDSLLFWSAPDGVNETP